jgi:hypothetical protein
MSWHQKLDGTEQMTDKEIEVILEAIDAKHIIPGMSWSRQTWGWSTECDIIKHKDDSLCFTGAGFSFGTDLPERFEKQAGILGYNCKLGKRD